MVETLRVRRVRHITALHAAPDNLLLEEAGPLAGRSVLVLGRGGFELTGALTLTGCFDAEFLSPSCRLVSGWLGSGGADVVLIPALEPDSEARVIAQAAAGLARSHGRIAIRLARHDRPLAARLNECLADAGFGPVTSRVRGAERVLSADFRALRH